jgi:hypothetical protein
MVSIFCTKSKYKQIKIDYIKNDKIISEELLWHKICFITQINLLKKPQNELFIACNISK